MDATITSTDIHITTQATSTRPAYQLHVLFPAAVDDERVQAKFNKKKNFITLTIPTLAHACTNDTPTLPATEAEAATTQSPTHSDTVTTVGSANVDMVNVEKEVVGETESNTLNGCGTAAVFDWAAHLGLSNRLIDQSCLSYN